MTILPLIERELGVRARRKITYWGRFGVGLGGLMLCLQRLLMPDWMYMAGGSAGKALFNSLTVLAFALCCTAGFSTTDSISIEVREGTLGLLFLTRVRWLDLLLGKLVANGLGLLATLATLFPLLMIPVLAGGITGGEILRKALVLFDTAFLCLAIGLNSSAFGRENVKAVRRTIAWLIFILLVAAIFPSPFNSICPLRTINWADDAEYRASSSNFWLSLALVQSMAWLFIWGAGIGLRRGLRESTPEAAAAADSTVQQWQDSNGERNPIEWAVGRESGLRAILWTAAVLSAGYLLIYRSFMRWAGVGRFGAFWLLGTWVPQTVFSAVSAALFAWAASRFLIESRRTGELELLLTTPVGAQTLVREQWRVMEKALRWPVLVMVLAVLLQFAIGVTSSFGFGRSSDWWLQYGLSCSFAILNTIVSIGAITRVGLWFGMKASSQSRAIISSVLLARGVPFLIGFCWSVLLTASGIWLRGVSNYYYIALVPQIATLMFYLWIIRAAKRGLLRDLAGPGEAGTGLFGALASIRADLAGGVTKCREWKVM